MMTTTKGGNLFVSTVSVVENVLEQHGKRLCDMDLESRKAEEAAMRRYEAAGWLRKMVGVVGGKDLPAHPSEEEFRIGLRSGIILCNVLNKVQPGAIPKVVESPSDQVLIPDGAALSAYQYFENVRNFLVIIEDIGIPTFEASDLNQGGKSARIVSCILALKSYNEWKEAGGKGLWKFGGPLKTSSSGNCFIRKNSDPFTSSLSKNQSMNERSMDAEQKLNDDLGNDPTKMTTNSLTSLVREILSDKKPEEVPMLVEFMLSKVMEEFDHRFASHSEMKMLGEGNATQIDKVDEESKTRILKQQVFFDKQKRELQELRYSLHTAKVGMQHMTTKYHEELSSLGKYLNGLANSASGYHKVVEENRKLYNQVQDLKGSIRVYCRVRPFLPGQPNLLSTVDSIEEGHIKISTASKCGKEGNRSFRFNKVFGPTATQEEVFADTQPLIRSVLDGYNVCIFAYGQTGSGKTFTMTGPKVTTEQSQGVNYRALSDLFLLAEQRKDTFSYDVSVQMIEIYNEQVRDLLVTDEIRNSSQKGLNVPDANIVAVASPFDVIEVMNVGQKNRAVGATALNDRSSRSHSCLTIHVQGRDMTSGATVRGCMHLVDLAGSERVNKSEATGDRLKEAQHINKSLSALGDVISSLAQKNAHVPYRNSKLTQLLQDSLGGQAKTLMFVHISPEYDAIGETISTLKFAERVATVELGAARQNKESGDVKELKEQIASLRGALAKMEGETEHLQPSTPRSSSPEKLRMKFDGSSPRHSNRQVGGESPGGHSIRTKPMNIQNIPKLIPKTTSFDLRELSTGSPPWPPTKSTGLKVYEKELGTGDWVDKVIVKEDVINGDDTLSGHCERDTTQLPKLFYRQHLPADTSKVFPDQPYNRFLACNRFETTSTDDSEDLEASTSDNSEPDLLWQINLPKVSNGVGSKIKKPLPMLGRSQSLEEKALLLLYRLRYSSPKMSDLPSSSTSPPAHLTFRLASVIEAHGVRCSEEAPVVHILL
ncbi:hypothetical protein IFM89_003912 [Coptis chinensis]|uniref:Uncharacterized protein n=1 Tax=Coptis chinensis TaxID=261450 RepID=A0A835IKT3_9MAGN|nr:hypothetical protein IFM89_003912 [Coptis chinensis]